MPSRPVWTGEKVGSTAAVDETHVRKFCGQSFDGYRGPVCHAWPSASRSTGDAPSIFDASL